MPWFRDLDEWTDEDERRYVVTVDARTFDQWVASLDAGPPCSKCGSPMFIDGDGGEEWGGFDGSEGFGVVAWCRRAWDRDDFDGHDQRSFELTTKRLRS